LTGPSFGLTVGQQYDLQWPHYNGTSSNCTAATPDQCFNRSPCAGDLASPSTMWNVSQYWGANIDGYWGDNANSVINAEVLDLIQEHPIAAGDLITMSSGNKAAEATALDTRVNQDLDNIHNDIGPYMNNPFHNGRRLIDVPVLNPTANGTYVVGFGAFLLLSNGNPSNFYQHLTGNDGFCAVYVGQYKQGGDSGGATGGGSYRIMLVQ
jgi:hypothetical protein